jgi:sugar lactone lactonase YvrE
MNKNWCIYLIFLSFALILFSCNRHASVGNTTKDIVIFPAPPDTTRIQFLKSISNSQSVSKPRSKFVEFVIGKTEVAQINKPYGVNVKFGKLYITDTGFEGLVVIDLEKRDFNYFIPKGRGQLKMPINCFVSDDDYLYVADSKRSQVVVFNKEREYVNAIGDTGKFKPTDVFVFNKKIYVTNIKNNKINVYDADSLNKFLFSFPESEVGDEDYLYSPTNLFIRNDKVYVSDIGGFNVKVYSLDGKYIKTIGSYGRGVGQFSRNKGVAVDKDENVYVVDASFENVQIFNKEAQLLMFFGGSYAGPGYMWLPAKVTIDYDNLQYFQQFVDPAFNLKYVVFVTNQYGPDKINVYGAVEPKK